MTDLNPFNNEADTKVERDLFKLYFCEGTIVVTILVVVIMYVSFPPSIIAILANPAAFSGASFYGFFLGSARMTADDNSPSYTLNNFGKNFVLISSGIGMILSALTMIFPPLGVLVLGSVAGSAIFLITIRAVNWIRKHYYIPPVTNDISASTPEDVHQEKQTNSHAVKMSQLLSNGEDSETPDQEVTEYDTSAQRSFQEKKQVLEQTFFPDKNTQEQKLLQERACMHRIADPSYAQVPARC